MQSLILLGPKMQRYNRFIIDESFKGYFIRSPKVEDKSSEINVLASHEGEPVMLCDGNHLASSFHPEIGGNNKIHQYFIDKING